MVVFGQNLLYWGSVVVFRIKWLCSGKVVVFGKFGCIRGKWLHSVKGGCNWPKEVVFG